MQQDYLHTFTQILGRCILLPFLRTPSVLLRRELVYQSIARFATRLET